MVTPTPVRDGYRAVLRRPVVVLAEVAWRWATGAAVAALILLSVQEYLHSLRVSDSDLIFWRSGQLILMLETAANILQGSVARMLRIVAILLPAIIVIWTVTAAQGRAVTVRILASASRSSLPALLALSFFRAMTALAALLAYFGTALILSASTTAGVPSPGLVLAWFLSVLLVCCAWMALNWFLSLAAIFAGRGHRLHNAMAQTGAALRRRGRELMSVGVWFALPRAVALGGATVAALILLASGKWVGVALSVSVVLAYFVVADAMYLARLASYMEIMEPGSLAGGEQRT